MNKKFLIGTFAFAAFAGVLTAAEAPGVNLALKAKASASSRESDTVAAANVNDHKYATHWSSLRSDSQWLMLDFGAPETFSCVVIFWGNAYSRKYKIEVSNDGRSWKTVSRQKNGQGNFEDIYWENSITARYIRLANEKNATDHGISIHEFQVFVK